MKKYFIGFILGAVIFGSIGVLASGILASQITYNNTTVDLALEDLYSKVPSGTQNINANGNYDISKKERVNVQVLPTISKFEQTDLVAVSSAHSVTITGLTVGKQYTFICGRAYGGASNSSYSYIAGSNVFNITFTNATSTPLNDARGMFYYVTPTSSSVVVNFAASSGGASASGRCYIWVLE